MMLETFTIRPAGDLRSSGKSFWVSATVPKKFVSNVSRRISDGRVLVRLPFGSGLLEVVLSFQMAALLMRISSRPYSFLQIVISSLMGTLICNVQLKRFNLVPCFSQFLGDGFSFLIVSARENHVNVLADQFTCRLQPQTAVTAGDQRDASICVLHGETPSPTSNQSKTHSRHFKYDPQSSYLTRGNEDPYPRRLIFTEDNEVNEGDPPPQVLLPESVPPSLPSLPSLKKCSWTWSIAASRPRSPPPSS